MAVVLEWVETGQVFPLPLGRPVVIGRGQRAEIDLGDIRVSRQHCQARWEGCAPHWSNSNSVGAVDLGSGSITRRANSAC